MRYCCSCQHTVGGTSQTLAEDDYAVADKLGLCRRLRSDALPYVCNPCQCALQGCATRFAAFFVAWSASLLAFCIRIWPAAKEFKDAKAHVELLDYISSDAFHNTRHGSGSFFTDRCTLYCVGELSQRFFGDNAACKCTLSVQLDFFFALLICRLVMNDGDAMNLFLRIFEAAHGVFNRKKLLLHADWCTKLAADIWDRGMHHFGYGARALPHNATNNKLGVQQHGMAYVVGLCKASIRRTVWPWSPRAIKGSAATAAFLQKLLGVRSETLLCTVLARDLGCVFGAEVFDSTSWPTMGSNSVLGFKKFFPEMKLPKGLSWEKLHARFSEMQLSKLQATYPHIANRIPMLGTQTCSHQWCEIQQQQNRIKQKPARERRSDEQLRCWAQKAFQRTGNTEIASSISTRSASAASANATVHDNVVLLYIASVFPVAQTANGEWDFEALHAVLEPARKRRKL